MAAPRFKSHCNALGWVPEVTSEIATGTIPPGVAVPEVMSREPVCRTASVTFADADLLGSATLVAVTVTVCREVTLTGAVYKPAPVIEPRLGVRLQVTVGSPGPPVTAAVNDAF